MNMPKYKAFIDKNSCVGCGACITACPMQAIHMKPGWKSEVNQQFCIGCGNCVSLCHRQAPHLYKSEEQE